MPLKNFRKGCKQSAADEPPAKRRRTDDDDEVEITEEEYDDGVEKLKDEYTKKLSKKGKQNPSEVKRLMVLTWNKRQQWI